MANISMSLRTNIPLRAGETCSRDTARKIIMRSALRQQFGLALQATSSKPLTPNPAIIGRTVSNERLIWNYCVLTYPAMPANFIIPKRDIVIRQDDYIDTSSRRAESVLTHILTRSELVAEREYTGFPYPASSEGVTLNTLLEMADTAESLELLKALQDNSYMSQVEKIITPETRENGLVEIVFKVLTSATLTKSTTDAEISSLDSIPDDKARYGNKAVNLNRLIKLGLPVPPGFVISSERLKREREFCIEMFWEEIHRLEERTQRTFGAPNNPLTFSVRSSPPSSMPGLLNTILNVATGQQLIEAVGTVRDSWFGEAAQRYRAINKISDDPITAAVIQVMVFGDLNNNSGSGVIFTQNPLSGSDYISGCFAVRAPGKSIVSRSTAKILTINPGLERKFPHIYQQFLQIKDILEREFRRAQEVEFVIEDGKLHVLQTRDAVLSPQAQGQATLTLTRKGIINQDEIAERLRETRGKNIYKLDDLYNYQNRINGYTIFNAIGQGEVSSSPGVAVGPIAFTLAKALEFAQLGKPAILIALERTEEIQAALVGGEISGIITQYGHEALHEAVLARAQGIPMLDGKLIGSSMADHSRHKDDPRIEGQTLLIGEHRITEGTEIVLDSLSRYFWLKRDPPILIKTVELQGIDLDYSKEEQLAMDQFEPYDYNDLLQFHAEMIVELGDLSVVTANSIRLNLAAHVIHQLIYKKGQEAGKSRPEIDSNIIKASVDPRSHSGELYIIHDKKTAKDLGIKEVRILDSGLGIFFLPYGHSTRRVYGRALEKEKIDAAIKAHQDFIDILIAKGFGERFKVLPFNITDPMPHGHESGLEMYTLGVEFDLESMSKPERIEFANKLFSMFSTDSK